MRRKSFLVTAMSTLITGCAHHTVATAQFQDIGASGEPLKSVFNEDAGKVRILMLVSPT